MSNVADYLLHGFLSSVGWPIRRFVFFGPRFVKASVLDVATLHVLRFGVGLGAGRPRLAANLIADSFDRDWTAQAVQELLDDLDEDHGVRGEESPWQAVAPLSWSEEGETVAWSVLADDRIGRVYVRAMAKATALGLLHPREAEDAVDRDRAIWRGTQRKYLQAGLEPTEEYPWPSNEEFFEHCEDVVRSFEVERRSLVEAPPALLASPRIAWRFRTP